MMNDTGFNRFNLSSDGTTMMRATLFAIITFSLISTASAVSYPTRLVRAVLGCEQLSDRQVSIVQRSHSLQLQYLMSCSEKPDLKRPFSLVRTIRATRNFGPTTARYARFIQSPKSGTEGVVEQLWPEGLRYWRVVHAEPPSLAEKVAYWLQHTRRRLPLHQLMKARLRTLVFGHCDAVKSLTRDWLASGEDPQEGLAYIGMLFACDRTSFNALNRKAVFAKMGLFQLHFDQLLRRANLDSVSGTEMLPMEWLPAFHIVQYYRSAAHLLDHQP